MKIAICDDVAKEREYASGLVEALGESRGTRYDIEVYDSAQKLLFSLQRRDNPPDIVLLDVMMPKIDGVEAARKMRADGYHGIIIYLSRSLEFALPAFDVEAFSYVLKGADNADERFERVLTRAIKRVEDRSTERILVNNISEHRNIPIADIDWFESKKHLIVVHYSGAQTFEFLSAITKMENRLIPYGFVRIHRSYLVNRASIASFNRNTVTLFDGTELPVSRQRFETLQQVMQARDEVDRRDDGADEA